MKTPVRVVFSLLTLLVMPPWSKAAAPAPDRPSGWLGIWLGEATPSSAERPGVRVGGVIEDGPGDKGRLRANDSIVAVNGVAVSANAEFLARIRELQPGSLVTLSVNRKNKDIELRTTLGSRPDFTEPPKPVRGRIGIDAIDLPASLRDHFGAPENAGILVSSVLEGGPAEDSGIRVGDVIYEADGQPVDSIRALATLVDMAGAENPIEIVLARDGARIVVEPRIERRP